MDKYRNLLISNMNRQLGAWLDGNVPVAHEEVVRFLHSLKGTSGTLGMNELHQCANDLHDEAARSPKTTWDVGVLRTFFLPLIKHGYQQAAGSAQVQELPDSAGGKGDQGKPSDQDPDHDKPLVLVVDDDVALLIYLKDELEQAGWSVIATAYPNKAIDYFHDVRPDCLILDLHIPDANGFEVIGMLGEKLRRQYIPTTIISHDCLKETRLKAYRLGVDDIMCKPLDMEELLARLERQLNNKRRLDRLLFVDELTGAYNRKYMFDLYGKLTADLNKAGEPFSLAILDIDHFKKVNDRYGHMKGDQVLREFSAYMKRNLRTHDNFIRYGGEEFVAIMPRTSTREAKDRLTRLIEGFAQVAFDSAEGTFSCTFSAGVVQVDRPGNSMQYWLEQADQALYQAKEAGRRRVEAVGDAQITSHVSKRQIQIAVVDDDPMIRALLSDRLKAGAQDHVELVVRTYRDGETFVASLSASDSAPCLVILDVVMPGMYGHDVLQSIKQMPNASRFTVIMLTGRKSQKDIVRALQLGADDYMTKPFGIPELEARIRRLIRRML